MLLKNFDIDTIRTCSMHNVNLGLLFTANGSALLAFCIAEICLSSEFQRVLLLVVQLFD